MWRDHLGLLWIGTRHGLNVRDGYDMTVYLHEPDHPHSLSDNAVWDIAEDPWGDIWVGTNAGLNRFDRSARRFDACSPVHSNPDSLEVFSVMSLL